jgi:hypothetical protein
MRARTIGRTRATKLAIAHMLTAVVTMPSGTAVCSPAMPTSGAATPPKKNWLKEEDHQRSPGIEIASNGARDHDASGTGQTLDESEYGEDAC